MRLTVFGATGRLGLEIVRAAHDRGHRVTAYSRRSNPSARVNAEWVTGEVGDVIQNADAVLIAFGPRVPSEAPFCAGETGKILDGMRRHGVDRILCVTGAMVGDYPANRTWFFQRLASWIQGRYPALMEDRARQEMMVRSSGMKWTVFKPPRLTTGAPRGKVTVGPSVRVGLLSSIARADLAGAMVDEAGQGRWIGQCVFIRGPA